MTGYQSKKKAAIAKTIDEVNLVDHEPDGRRAAQKFIEAENKKVSERYGYVPKLHPSEWQDKLAQPAQDSNWAWACNECGAQEFTSALSEADLDYLACANCGGNEFHKEALAQPAQEPVALVIDGVLVEYAVPEKYTGHLYTISPQRTWVGLTAQEAAECWTTSATQTWKNFEAKLKDKNNG